MDPQKQDGVVFKIFCECSEVYIGETRRCMHEQIKKHDKDIRLLQTQTSDHHIEYISKKASKHLYSIRSYKIKTIHYLALKDMGTVSRYNLRTTSMCKVVYRDMSFCRTSSFITSTYDD